VRWEDLTDAVARGTIDTVRLAITDRFEQL
jgi:hypothetical protein